MADPGTRVVLLARPGPACEQLSDALRQAGAELVLVADPTVGSPEDLVSAAPQAVLVALDPAVEEALARFDDVLADPQITVIFDEAELAAQRTGWDSARWVRHLSAKLNRHQDVLPPGGEEESAWHPMPGRVASAATDDAGLDITAFAGEAQRLADDLPSDSGLRLVAIADTETGAATEALVAADDFEFDAASFELPAGFVPDTDTDADVAAADRGPAPEPVDLDAVNDEFLAKWAGGAEGDLGSEDAAVARQAGFVRDLEDLDRRVAGIELADVDSYGHGPERGAVLIEAGLGGPDAVRQLLGELPERFPRPVLVRLRLDGGRYDRLVRQMERATILPVSLALEGQVAEAGHVYFLSPQQGLSVNATKLVFSDAAGPESLPGALPAKDSAMLFLSGSDPALVETAMNSGWGGAMVSGQAPEGCYDAAASTDVIARGGASGTPSELAEQLATRWPS